MLWKWRSIAAITQRHGGEEFPTLLHHCRLAALMFFLVLKCVCFYAFLFPAPFTFCSPYAVCVFVVVVVVFCCFLVLGGILCGFSLSFCLQTMETYTFVLTNLMTMETHLHFWLQYVFRYLSTNSFCHHTTQLKMNLCLPLFQPLPPTHTHTNAKGCPHTHTHTQMYSPTHTNTH